MAPVPLPQLSEKFLELGNLPNEPHDPPTLKDAASSCVMAFRAVQYRNKSGYEVSDEDIVRTELYRSKIMADFGGGEPAWFQAAMAHALEPLSSQQDVILKELRLTRRLAAITWNKENGTNINAQLELVPFSDGSDPTSDPHNLPPITSVQALRDMNRRQKKALRNKVFKQGYAPP